MQARFLREGECLEYASKDLEYPSGHFVCEVNQKLNTRDWLQTCHIPLQSVCCPVCGQEEESHTHLFFDCVFSRNVICAVKRWLKGFAWPMQFSQWIKWLALPRDDGFSVVLHASCAAAVYHIWQNRNLCWHDNFCLPVYRIDHLIRFSLKARILNLVGSNCSVREKQMLQFVMNL
ncbi:uncharacterized protein LOC133825324 [Humulus lupulus]|uniref:uncharacterized protein LOC133825324 n=1 Tax=Humulus lupulus TaxID=3486 RepID=UPI002B404349|nr:uncharacterized protein LOC133825324 [Humulus lupulus]